MTQEEKDLLLKDLSARLPYKVKVRVKNNEREREWYGVSGYDTTVTTDSISKLVDSNFKPYLRPMSSMTEEEASDYIDVIVDDGVCSTETRTIWYDEMVSSIKCFDWLNTHHFDYRGLIEKGLALEAPEGMYEI